MIRLANRDLPREVADALSYLQGKVDGEPNFEARAEKAQSLWKTKGGTKGKQTFEVVVAELEQLCVGVGLCNYCEQNEANDVEHILPKSFFPEKAFVWENYLLACKQCNSAWKLDAIDVLDDQDNLIRVDRGQEPKFKRAAFINPRQEDPNEYMLLDLSTRTFGFIPGLSNEMTNKGRSTLAILGLNEREPLKQARFNAAKHYLDQMTRLKQLLESKDVNEFAGYLYPFDNRFDLTKPLEDLKKEVFATFKYDLQREQHPSVWHSIKVLYSGKSPWQPIFAAIPEALTW